MSTASLADIVRRLGAVPSDEEAWKWLSAHLWPILFATAYRILRGNRALAEDAVQEALLRLFRYAPFADFATNPDAFRSYALAISRNVSLRYLSYFLREQQFSDEVPYTEAPASPNADPELLAVRGNLLAKSVLSLNSEDRKLLELLLEGFNISEIAARLHLKYSNTAVRIYRLRNSLSKLLKIKR